MQHVPLCVLILAACIKNFVNCEQEDEEIVMVGNNVCVTNGSSAIIFNPPIEDTTERVTISEVFPRLENSILFSASIYELSRWWKIGPWKIVNSIEYLDDIVTDRRWENFTISNNHSISIYPRKTPSPYLGYGGYGTGMPSTSLPQEFRISFSARLEYEGQIYLCDISMGMDCIKISLQPRKIGVDLCKTHRNFGEEQHECVNLEESTSESMLDQDLWTHFRIEATNKRLTVMHSGMNYFDFVVNVYEYVTPGSLLFKSPLGFWKIHSYDFLYTDEKYNNVLGPTIIPMKKRICIDMFTVMCKYYCRIQISIVDNHGTRLFSRVYRTPDERWTRVLIQLDDVDDYVNMRITTIGEAKSQFWALDDIRQCNHTYNENQYRYIRTDQPNSPCQKVGLTSYNIWDHTRNVDISTPYLMCGPDEVGTFCAPCQIFTNESKCNSFRYCEYVGYETVCRCRTDDCENGNIQIYFNRIIWISKIWGLFGLFLV